MRKRSWCFFTLLLLALGILPAPAFGRGQGEEGAAEKPYPLVYLISGDIAAKPLQPDDRVVAEINRRLGIELKVKAVTEEQWESINVAIASGDLPDVVVGSFPSAATSQWIRDGVLAPLNDYLDLMPTVKAKCLEEAWTAVEGKYYGYPFIQQKDASNYNIIFRGDWLDKLGLEVPRTLEEFYTVLKAFATRDPDGNGKNDTYGWTSQKPPAANIHRRFDFIFYAYGMAYADWALDNKGRVIPRHEHPAFKKGLQFLRRLWDEGLMEREFLLNDYQMMLEKWYRGKAGACLVSLYRHVNRIEGNLQKVDPQGRMVYTDPPTGPGGKRGLAHQGKLGMLTAVTVGSKNPRKAARFVEFMISPEGRELLTLGVEGIHYTRQGDKIVYHEEERARDNFAKNGWSHPLAWGQMTWPLESRYLPQTEPQRERALESVEMASRNQMPNLIPLMTATEIELGGIVNELYNQYLLELILGRLDLDQGLEELKKKWRAQGGDKILAEVQEVYEQYK